MPGTGMTMTDTDSGWSSPRAEEAASEEGGQTLAEAVEEELLTGNTRINIGILRFCQY